MSNNESYKSYKNFLSIFFNSRMKTSNANSLLFVKFRLLNKPIFFEVVALCKQLLCNGKNGDLYYLFHTSIVTSLCFFLKALDK